MESVRSSSFTFHPKIIIFMGGWYLCSELFFQKTACFYVNNVYFDLGCECAITHLFSHSNYFKDEYTVIISITIQ